MYTILIPLSPFPLLYLSLLSVHLISPQLIGVFGAYPIIDNIVQASAQLSFVNATGQIPEIQGYRGLIDRDTPQSALKRTGFDGEEYSLVFSDEFEQEGRTFWPGDDPYWTAVDSHYCESTLFSMLPSLVEASASLFLVAKGEYTLNLCCLLLFFPASLHSMHNRCHQQFGIL